MEQFVELKKYLPTQYITEPENRLCYIYLFSSMVLAFIFYCFYRKQSNFNSFFKYFFNVKVLLHASSRTDFYLFLLNFWIKIILIFPFIFSADKINNFVQNSLANIFPGFHIFTLSPLLYSCFYTIVFFIVTDFSRYIVHYCLHKIPFLWAIHKVHHSAKVLTPLTLYRMHPIEAIIFLIRQIFITGFVAGMFLFFIDGKYPMITIIGVQIFSFIFNFFGANLRHSHVPISFGSKLEVVLISPIMHQMHHSINYNKSTKNLGSTLSIWDKLFGTYLKPDFKPIRFGLSKDQRK